MAKSIRSKVKKRLRTVKRGVIKKELVTSGTQHNDREVSKAKKYKDAQAGYLEPGKQRKNAFRSDDPEAEIPQHDWRQGPDFRSGYAGEDAGLAVWGTSRPKVDHRAAPQEPQVTSSAGDARFERLKRATEQLVPFMASKKTKKRIKASNSAGAAVGERKFRFV